MVISRSFLFEDPSPIESGIEQRLKRNMVFLCIISISDGKTTV
jgi:hypothetical protein